MVKCTYSVQFFTVKYSDQIKNDIFPINSNGIYIKNSKNAFSEEKKLVKTIFNKHLTNSVKKSALKYIFFLYI